MTYFIIAIEGIIIIYLWWEIKTLSKSIISLSQTLPKVGYEIDEIKERIDELESIVE